MDSISAEPKAIRSTETSSPETLEKLTDRRPVSKSLSKAVMKFKEPLLAKRTKKDTTPSVIIGDHGPNQLTNPLSELIPGYKAPLRLIPTSNETCKTIGGLEQLRRNAVAEETSQWKWVLPTTLTGSAKTATCKATNSNDRTSFATAVTSFKTGHKKRKKPPADAGKGWFGMQPTPMTDELKRDLVILKNRRYLDPKRFYKKESGSELSSKCVQVGTVIEGTGEYFSSRLTNKQRRSNLTEEVMSDRRIHDYAIGKYKDIGFANQQAAQRRKKKPTKAFKM